MRQRSGHVCHEAVGIAADVARIGVIGPRGGRDLPSKPPVIARFLSNARPVHFLVVGREIFAPLEHKPGRPEYGHSRCRHNHQPIWHFKPERVYTGLLLHTITPSTRFTTILPQMNSPSREIPICAMDAGRPIFCLLDSACGICTT